MRDAMIEYGGLRDLLRERGHEVPDGEPGGDALRDRPDRALVSAGLVGEAEMAEALAAYLGVPFAGTERFPAAPLEAGGATLSFLRQSRILPVEERADLLILAVADPLDRSALQAMELLVGKEIRLEVASPSDLDRAFDRLYGQGADTALAQQGEKAAATGEDGPAVRLLEDLVRTAISNRASDLHLEPSGAGLRLRYRIDGRLMELGARPPAYLTDMLVGRIKVLSGLNIAEKRLPQDGRASMSVAGRKIDIRVSTAPTLNGESVVLRLLDPERGPTDIERLGLAPPVAEALTAVLAAPHGMVLATGPTGSGKTTTLYAALRRLNLAERKIVTLEDPIEYRLDGVNQIQVNPRIGLGFANLLRSVLRHDPDVIMVGEIRDEETARLAVQAALTGHLVLSTLHTNDAPGAAARLMDMGIEPYLLSASLRAVLAQRLVRRLCPECGGKERVEEVAATRLGLPSGSEIGKAVGCPRCHQTGYRGRLVLSEIMPMDELLEAAIAGRADASRLRSVLDKDLSMLADARRRLLAGETTAGEVLAVLGGARA
ncbi:GspE/PulE family protein [Nisaea acidiphila]|uniref:GspE/PulE family protein n=1 Tax=Nisaea acidiphila TaxID=1862145 RepID=A0A9J7ALU9_9PROT|nr:GspE/PulE family protein [Nisaea acidiphila]UUX48619.1 GspE/PulE family protein [Nisaea acidiphila]